MRSARAEVNGFGGRSRKRTAIHDKRIGCFDYENIHERKKKETDFIKRRRGRREAS